MLFGVKPVWSLRHQRLGFWVTLPPHERNNQKTCLVLADASLGEPRWMRDSHYRSPFIFVCIATSNEGTRR